MTIYWGVLEERQLCFVLPELLFITILTLGLRKVLPYLPIG